MDLKFLIGPKLTFLSFQNTSAESLPESVGSGSWHEQRTIVKKIVGYDSSSPCSSALCGAVFDIAVGLMTPVSILFYFILVSK